MKLSVNVAVTKRKMGLVCERQGNHEQARVLFEEQHIIFVRSIGSDHPQTKQAASNLEQCQQRQAQPTGGPAPAQPNAKPTCLSCDIQ